MTRRAPKTWYHTHKTLPEETTVKCQCPGFRQHTHLQISRCHKPWCAANVSGNSAAGVLYHCRFGPKLDKLKNAKLVELLKQKCPHLRRHSFPLVIYFLLQISTGFNITCCLVLLRLDIILVIDPNSSCIAPCHGANSVVVDDRMVNDSSRDWCNISNMGAHTLNSSWSPVRPLWNSLGQSWMVHGSTHAKGREFETSELWDIPSPENVWLSSNSLGQSWLWYVMMMGWERPY